jgi:FkbM family methyltransferase
MFDWLFGPRKQDVITGTPVVLFGTGSLGKELMVTLKFYGISPVCFCNSDNSKSGSLYCGMPVISIDELERSHKNSLILIATQTHAASVQKLLLDNGFRRDRVLWPKDFDMALGLYFSYVNQITLAGISKMQTPQQTLFDLLAQNEKIVKSVYDNLADQKSKDLFVAKLAFAVSHDNLGLFKDFMWSFSEPITMFGLIPFPDPGPENYFYFNNDVFPISPNEVYVDVGAYDGDSVNAFVQTCKYHGLDYKQIYAFEPDPNNYKALIKNTENVKKISCHQLGIWSRSEELSFNSSEKAPAPSGSGIDETGDIKINVVSLDKILSGKEVTFLKMDPPGDIIPEALKGASKTITKYRPKLVLGAYHSFEAIFKIPFLVNGFWPDYKLYLRHNSWACAETDLYAVI